MSTVMFPAHTRRYRPTISGDPRKPTARLYKNSKPIYFSTTHTTDITHISFTSRLQENHIPKYQKPTIIHTNTNTPTPIPILLYNQSTGTGPPVLYIIGPFLRHRRHTLSIDHLSVIQCMLLKSRDRQTNQPTNQPANRGTSHFQ